MELTLIPSAPFTTKHWRKSYYRFQDSSFSWDQEKILLTISVHSQIGVVTIKEEGSPQKPLLKIECQGINDPERVQEKIAHLLGVEEAVLSFYQSVEKDPIMSQLVHQFTGTRMFRVRSFFEAVVITVLEQQVSMLLATTWRERLIQNFSGKRFSFQGKTIYTFPTPAELASFKPTDLRSIGIPLRKAEAILTFAHELERKSLNPYFLSKKEPQEILAKLREFPGIGKWSAQFIITRWLGPKDVFPCSDLGIRQALARFYLGGKIPSPSESEKFMERFSPWRKLAGFYLLLAYSQGGAVCPN